MKSAVILLSGGMDSVTLLHYIQKKLNVSEIYALSFEYGQKHSREIEMAKWQAHSVCVKEHRCLDISFFADLIAGSSALTDESKDIPSLTEISAENLDQPSTYVPNRNMILLSLAVAWAESKGVADVFYGAQAQDQYGYWDCTVDFLDKMNDVLCLNRGLSVTIRAPFVEKSKTEVLRLGLDMGVDYAHTWSCYKGGSEPCGICPTCIERDKAFTEAGYLN